MSDVFKFNTEDSLKIETAPAPKVTVPIFNLVSENDPILKKVMPEFDFENPPTNPNQLASSLVETCIKHRGYGLSANQCGLKYRVFVMGAGTEYVAFFNPTVVAMYDETHMVEGCLSFPMLALGITRAAAIDVEYQDYTGAFKSAHYTGISARCFLHELDHMNGIVYTSRAKSMALQSGMKKRGKISHLMQKAQKSINKIEAIKK
jgi:peptide deformylase